MKNLFFSAITVISAMTIYSFSAKADSVFNLSTLLATMTCTQTNNEVDCTTNPTAPNFTNVPVTISNCGTDSNGSETCSGTWTANVALNGIIYTAFVAVTSNAPAGGPLSYTLSYSIGSGNSQNGAFIFPAKAVLTDSTFTFAPANQGTSGTSYTAIFGLGPSPAALSSKLKHLPLHL
jgi:hypothetical protein